MSDTASQLASPRPLRVLMLIDGMESLTAGGTERQFIQLAQIAKRNGAVPVVAVLRNTRWLTPEIVGCPVYYFDLHTMKSLAGLRELGRLWSWLRKKQFDVLQTFFQDANLLGPFLGRLAGIPIIVGTRRCLSDPNQLPKTLSSWLYPLRNTLIDRVIANSHAVLQSVVEVEGLSRSKMEVIYNGLDLASLRVSRGDGEQVRRELHMAQGDLLVGNISGLRRVKGLEVFLEAALITKDRASNLRYVIVGEGEMRSVLEERITAYGLRQTVVLAGARHDVRPYLAAMDIAVLSSTAEGLSNSLLEYMAAGLPIVATDIGGNREAIGEAGIFVPPNSPSELAEAILRFRDPGLRRTMAIKSYNAAERFDIKIAERRMAEHFRTYIDSARMRQRLAGA